MNLRYLHAGLQSRRAWVAGAWLAAASVLSIPAHADGVSTLHAFVKDVGSGRGQFTQLVTSPDGKKTRKSVGSLEFQRPNRFRFEYKTPTPQLIVGDGQKVWLWDEDLNQVTVRPMSQALGASPAALLSGGSLDKDFALRNVAVPSGEPAGSEWVEATPRNKDGQFRSVRVGFKAGALMALDIEDGFGQHSRLTFTQFESRVSLPANRFQFTPPKGADVLDQP
ncbi:outer membrane lipoprotein chaperone LolA [Aquabacterium sp.]|uniref:outer membrane lipoprotein chaperone LolA n=1 Tax=Aquabacterium sp. TaxID=1872578 RepID=UPI0035ADBBC9